MCLNSANSTFPGPPCDANEISSIRKVTYISSKSTNQIAMCERGVLNELWEKTKIVSSPSQLLVYLTRRNRLFSNLSDFKISERLSFAIIESQIHNSIQVIKNSI